MNHNSVQHYTCFVCGEALTRKETWFLFDCTYCAECANEILNENDVLENDDRIGFGYEGDC